MSAAAGNARQISIAAQMKNRMENRMVKCLLKCPGVTGDCIVLLQRRYQVKASLHTGAMSRGFLVARQSMAGGFGQTDLAFEIAALGAMSAAP
jgi:hypothetical protein